ncbi:class I SAM-dependent methyltransferase [Streptomyces griseorubiginosus]|uniref:class I SAM-dependent methyltransferase n=1 Tax=Streptomyces griseorubiginosus TaxID=67304 RepID=UPI00076C9600|nr:class I SAM-dependent methyltransferase [Streptomyces griseorubiginosus]KUM68581.1 methyltransferase type 11 [Streptomyces griseorubiginosus]
MPTSDSQIPYWNAAASKKTFTHPLHLPWIRRLDGQAAILDYGCGYGRVMAELQQLGFHNLTGTDTSPHMIRRARHTHPTLSFNLPAELRSPPASFDAALLFAVLTCIPDDLTQHRLITQLYGLLKPGGVLYVSDVLLQPDDRNRRRYDRDADTYGTYGVFRTSDGAICRHHSRERLSTLLTDFEITDSRTVPVPTMNGHAATAIQLLAQKPAPCRAA